MPCQVKRPRKKGFESNRLCQKVAAPDIEQVTKVITHRIRFHFFNHAFCLSRNISKTKMICCKIFQFTKYAGIEFEFLTNLALDPGTATLKPQSLSSPNRIPIEYPFKFGLKTRKMSKNTFNHNFYRFG